MDKDEFLTFQEVADYLRVSRWTVGRLAKAGELTKVPIGTGKKDARISAKSLHDFVARRIRSASKETR